MAGIPRLHKETALFNSHKSIGAKFELLADSITSVVAGNESYTGPDGVTRASSIGTLVRQTASNVVIQATSTANTAAAAGASLISSLINVASDGVLISADKVDIEGAAIFHSGGALAKVVTSSQTQWYSSTSQTELAGGEWSSLQPTKAAGRYTWQRTHETYSDGTSAYLPSQTGVCLTQKTDLSAVETAVAGASARQQLIYRSAAPGTATMDANTTWVTASGDTQNAWTTKRPTFSASYPVLFVATQRQTVAQQKAGSDCLCTAPVRDDTTTVIDGGSISTGSIDASRITANLLTALQAVVTDLRAIGATIGGFVIDATSIHTNGKEVTSSDDASVALSTADFARTVNGSSRSGLRFAIGSKLGIAKDGTLYANGANVTDLSASNITTGTLSSDRIAANSITADKIDATAITIGQSQVTGLTESLAGKATAADIPTALSDLEADIPVEYTGTSTSTATDTSKIAACLGFRAANLVSGATIRVRFSNASTAQDALTLNVNSTGAKTIYVGGSATSSSNCLLWAAGASITFTYTGSYWQVVGEPRSWHGTCSTAAATAAKTASISEVVLLKGTNVSLEMSYENSASSPTLNISSLGAFGLYTGSGTTRPTTSNGISWASGTTQTFSFDGQYWLMADSGTAARVSDAAKTATDYITEINITGVQIHPSGTTSDRLQLTSSGMEIYKDSSSVALYQYDQMRIGRSSYGHVLVNSSYSSSSIQLKSGSKVLMSAAVNGSYGQVTTDQVNVNNFAEIVSSHIGSLRIGGTSTGTYLDCLIVGTQVVQFSGGNEVTIFSAADVRSLTGLSSSSISQESVIVVGSNGDGSAYSGNVTVYLHSTYKSIKVRLSSSFSGPVRCNYAIFVV